MGSRTVKVEPRRGALVASISPPIALVSSRAM
jgi:hypothetical protein